MRPRSVMARRTVSGSHRTGLGATCSRLRRYHVPSRVRWCRGHCECHGNEGHPVCGFAGILAPQGDRTGVPAPPAMAATLSHRGPDDSGEWAEPGGQAALGFRRLSIIDLARGPPADDLSGRPLHDRVQRRDYNFAALRGELEAAGHRFADGRIRRSCWPATTAWGVEDDDPASGACSRSQCGTHSSGGSTWSGTDSARNRCTTAGSAGRFLFGSELKALRAHPAFNARVDRSALASYLRFAYVPVAEVDLPARP